MSVFLGVLLGAGELCLFLLEERPQMLLSISCREGSCFFLCLQAQVLVAKVFSLGRQREKLMFLGRSVLLKLLSEVRQFPWGVLF